MVPTDPWTLAAASVVGVALLQVLLARWRDLGPVTLTAGGIAVVLASPSPPWVVWVGVASGALVAAFGWARGASRGIGHPSLDAVMLGVVIAASAALAALPDWPPGRITAATVIGVVGAVATAVSLRSRSVGHRQVRWLGEIPVAGPKPASPAPPAGG